MIYPDIVIDTFSKQVSIINPIELRRNTFGKSFIYNYKSDINVVFNSFYGNINNCKVKSTQIIL